MEKKAFSLLSCHSVPSFFQTNMSGYTNLFSRISMILEKNYYIEERTTVTNMNIALNLKVKKFKHL